MSLIDESKETCVIVEKKRVSDGEGGFTTSWVDGTEFLASIWYNSALEAKVAEAQGVTSLYTVTTDKTAMLEYHDVFRRKSDGKIFRVTSDGEDKQTPARATFSFCQVSAEEWEIPT